MENSEVKTIIIVTYIGNKIFTLWKYFNLKISDILYFCY